MPLLLTKGFFYWSVLGVNWTAVRTDTQIFLLPVKKKSMGVGRKNAPQRLGQRLVTLGINPNTRNSEQKAGFVEREHVQSRVMGVRQLRRGLFWQTCGYRVKKE